MFKIKMTTPTTALKSGLVSLVLFAGLHTRKATAEETMLELLFRGSAEFAADCHPNTTVRRLRDQRGKQLHK